MAENKKTPPFAFDFTSLAGLPFEDAIQSAFRQMEDHYNKYIIPAPIIFGGQKLTAPELGIISTPPPAPAPPPQEPVYKPDTETVTPKTIPLKVYQIDNRLLTGIAVDGREIKDTILKGYDVEPYGPVISGEHGRYNLKP